MSQGSELTVALIAAIPPTIGAMAAWRAASKAKQQVTPTNGTRLAAYVEGIHSRVVDLGVETMATRKLLESHAADDEAHHAILDHGHICQQCLSIDD